MSTNVDLMRILCVYAHPDDESFGPAAVLAKYARQGAAIYGLFATRGEHGEAVQSPAPSPRELAALRARDLAAAAEVIGFKRVDHLGYEDGTLADVPRSELERQVLDAVLAYRPDVMVTFGPAGITRHSDHVAIHQAATSAFHKAREHELGVRELFYDALPTDRAKERDLLDAPDGNPNTFVDVTETQPVKLEALRLHARSVADARDRVRELEQQQPQTVATLHRAWPEVAPGQVVADFLESDHQP